MKELLRKLPKVDRFIQDHKFANFNKKLLTKIAKNQINLLREQILDKKINNFSIDELVSLVESEYKKLLQPSQKPLINATGVILHTNMEEV